MYKLNDLTTMKRVMILIIGICLIPIITWAQENAVTRDLSIRLLDSRGRPIADQNVTVESSDSNTVVVAGSEGEVVLRGINEGDTVRFTVGSASYALPVIHEIDEVVVTARRPARGTNITVDFGYGTVDVRNNTGSVMVIETTPNEPVYQDLIQFLRMRIPGSYIWLDRRTSEPVSIQIQRGDISMSTDQGALIILDGVQTSLPELDRSIKPNDIKSVTVIRDGVMYGARGAGGVIVIATKTVEERLQEANR